MKMKIHRMARMAGLVLLASLLPSLLAACAGDGEPDGSAGAGAEQGKTDDASDVHTDGDLAIANGSDVITLSPHGANDIPSHNVIVNIYETLTELDENAEVQPGLAKDWEQVDDTTWDFYLEEDVSFHDGEKLNAEVVKKNLDRIMDEDIASPNASLLEAVDNVEATDEYTVRINLEYPYAPLLAHLAKSAMGMISPAVIEEDYAQMDEGEDVDGYINYHPVGTGPFEFEEWTPGEEVVITRNEDYWGDNAKLASITFKVIDEQSTRMAELDTGNVDVVNKVGPDNITRIEESPDAHLEQQSSTSLSHVGFNLEKEPFDDKRVRQAIAMAVDKEEIIDGVYNGIGTPPEGPLTDAIFGYDESIEGLGHDPEQAEQLLAEAGYEDGFETTIWVDGNEQRKGTAVSIQSQLSEVGIDVEIVELEFGAFVEKTGNGEHDMFIIGWNGGTADADQSMYPLFHSSQKGHAGNRVFLDDEEVDELLDEARRETDEDRREELYGKAQERLVDLAPMLYVQFNEYLLGVNDSVHNFDINAVGIYQLEDTYIEE